MVEDDSNNAVSIVYGIDSALCSNFHRFTAGKELQFSVREILSRQLFDLTSWHKAEKCRKFTKASNCSLQKNM